jgi:hypothetical protein
MERAEKYQSRHNSIPTPLRVFGYQSSECRSTLGRRARWPEVARGSLQPVYLSLASIRKDAVLQRDETQATDPIFRIELKENPRKCGDSTSLQIRSQFLEGISALSTTSTSTIPLVGSSLRPSCSWIAVNSDAASPASLFCQPEPSSGANVNLMS